MDKSPTFHSRSYVFIVNPLLGWTDADLSDVLSVQTLDKLQPRTTLQSEVIALQMQSLTIIEYEDLNQYPLTV